MRYTLRWYPFARPLQKSPTTHAVVVHSFEVRNPNKCVPATKVTKTIEL